MNYKIRELIRRSDLDLHKHWNDDGSNLLEEFAQLIINSCANYIRSNLDTDQAEPLAWNMEIEYGLHGDYAE